MQVQKRQVKSQKQMNRNLNNPEQWTFFCSIISKIANDNEFNYCQVEQQKDASNQEFKGESTKMKKNLDMLNKNKSKIQIMNKILQNLKKCEEIDSQMTQVFENLQRLHRNYLKQKRTILANINFSNRFSSVNIHSQLTEELDVNFETFQENNQNINNDILQKQLQSISQYQL